jgi:hypothetical protein
MNWVLIVGVGWLLLTVVAALVIGRAIYLADRRPEQVVRRRVHRRADGRRAERRERTGHVHLRAVDNCLPVSERVPAERTLPLP